MKRLSALLVGLGLVISGGCSDDDDEPVAPTTSTTTASSAPATTAPKGPVLATFDSGGAHLEVTEVARDLDTPWALAFEGDRLWWTERPGRLRSMGGPAQQVQGAVEQGEGGLMGLEIDSQGRKYVMYTGARDNRVVRLEPDGSQTVLVDGIAKAGNHDGGRIRFGPDGRLYASTGDAGQPDLAPRRNSLNGKILRIDPERGGVTVFSRGHRNAQGLCFTPGGRFLSTEHGPERGDEVNELREGADFGWPGTVGNGLRNYTSVVAPAGCTVYDGSLIAPWKGSMLFVTLRGEALRRLTFSSAGAVQDEEVLLEGRFGRLRDVVAGPDGAVYLATSNQDGRGSPQDGDDRILRIAPAAQPAPTTTAAAASAPSGAAAQLRAAGDPQSVAATLAEAEPAIRDPATPAAELEGHGHAQQVAYRQLVEHPEWMDAVLARIPPGFHPTVRANAMAGTELRALTAPRTSLPPWRIVAPAPAAELLGYYREAGTSIGVPWPYLAAIHLVETRMGRIRGTSTAGAQGPMQFLPATWRQYGAGGDINSNRDSIFAAARLLRRNGAPDNMANALFNYNRSQRYVRAVTAYAEQMGVDERAYSGYYHWQVYYRMVDGDRFLPVGYGG